MKHYVVTPKKEYRIGDVSIFPIFEQLVAFTKEQEDWMFPGVDLTDPRLDWCVPDFLTPDRHLIFCVNEWLLQVHGQNILIDTGLTVERGDLMLRGLAEHGVKPEDINYVLFTHLHHDHCGGNTWIGEYARLKPMFPNARYVFVRENYEFHKAVHDNPELQRGDASYDLIWQFPVQMQFLVENGMVDFVEADHKFSDEIQFVPNPGHDKGMVAFLIQSKGDSCYIAADVMHHPFQMVMVDCSSSVDYDGEVTKVTRREMLESLADTDTLFLASHVAGDYAHFVKSRGDGTFYLVKAE